MRRLIAWMAQRFDDACCRLGKCRSCVLFDTPSGVGGRCTNCGDLHGWMSHAEIRAALDGRRPGATTPIEKYPDPPKVVAPPRAYWMRGPKGWQ